MEGIRSDVRKMTSPSPSMRSRTARRTASFGSAGDDCWEARKACPVSPGDAAAGAAAGVLAVAGAEAAAAGAAGAAAGAGAGAAAAGAGAVRGAGAEDPDWPPGGGDSAFTGAIGVIWMGSIRGSGAGCSSAADTDAIAPAQPAVTSTRVSVGNSDVMKRVVMWVFLSLAETARRTDLFRGSDPDVSDRTGPPAHA